MDVNKLSVLFLRDYRREHFDVPVNAYLNYTPINVINKEGLYPVTEFARYDAVTLIKHKYKELWVYEDVKGNLFMAPLKCNENGFAELVPVQFYVEYLDEPSFVLYKQPKFGSGLKFRFLKYVEGPIPSMNMGINGKRTGDDNAIIMSWVDDVKKATPFFHDKIEWNEQMWRGLDKTTQKKYD